MALTEEGYEALGERMLALYDEAERIMLQKVANRLKKGVASPGWTEKKFSEAQAVRRSLENALNGTRKERREIVSRALENAYESEAERCLTDNDRFIRAMGIDPILSPNAWKAAAIQTELDAGLDAAERRVLRQFDDGYADVIAHTSSLVASGVYTNREALQASMREFADEGIFGFIDRSGRRWDLGSYAEMALLTAVERATVSGYVDTMQAYGFDLAYISSHAGACPLCVPWEDVVVSVSGDTPGYPTLDEAIAAGAFHPRCLHDLNTYHEGISHVTPRTEPREREAPSAEYTARSKQRYMERQIRKYKRRMAAATTKEAERQAFNKVRQWQGNLREHLKNAPTYLPRQYWREGGRQTLRLQ